ncbi:hypothetical protein GLOIN_2v1838806 [Rhizophagus irregularis DAOM 181602=DAOM 197198]|nr:hypothetical protein GLOIN_2v1838806 [Rhizophagus irregularis DAOM 181602=DAOM 197198]
MQNTKKLSEEFREKISEVEKAAFWFSERGSLDFSEKSASGFLILEKSGYAAAQNRGISSDVTSQEIGSNLEKQNPRYLSFEKRCYKVKSFFNGFSFFYGN